MSTLDLRARARQEDAEPQLPVVIGRAIWENCPILLGIDIAIVLACLPALLLAGAGGLIAVPLLLALTLGPVWIAAVSAAEAVLDAEAVGLRRFGTLLRSGWRTGIRIWIVPAAIATVLLGTLALAGGGGRRWMLVPAFVDGIVLSGASVVALGTSWLAARGDPANRSLWRRAALLAGTAPPAIGGIVAVAVLIVLAAQVIGPLMLGILAAPFAVLVAAVFRHVAAGARMTVDA